MSDTLIETETLRVRIVRDDHPEEPYDDGSSPILRYEASRAGDARAVQQVTAITSYEVADDIIDALIDAESGELFEAYLRDHHGVTQVVWFTDHPVTYVSFDPADWRERMGLTDDHLAAHPDVQVVNVDEYRAWLEGECYGYVLEELQLWRNEQTGSKREEWEQVDSCWGFYGSEYVEQEARRVFADEAAERGIEVPA
jgi:hypothetical protein